MSRKFKVEIKIGCNSDGVHCLPECDRWERLQHQNYRCLVFQERLKYVTTEPYNNHIERCQACLDAEKETEVILPPRPSRGIPQAGDKGYKGYK